MQYVLLARGFTLYVLVFSDVVEAISDHSEKRPHVQ